jgi:hypothetical protein
MLVILLSLLGLLIIGDSQASDVCFHEVWAPTDCKVQAFRVMSGLKFIVTASERVQRFYMALSEEVPDMNGNFANTKGEKGSTNNVKMWTVDFPNLIPDKLYYYVLKVIDKKGCKSHKVGAHWTNVRSFHLHISKIHVYEDGDAGQKGKGECDFYAYGNGKQILKYGSIYKSWVTAGQTISANISGILKNIAPGNLTLKILGREADRTSGSIVDSPTTYDTASKTMTLDLNEWEKNNPAEREFQVRAQGSALDFEAYCKGLVYYNKGENRTDPDVSHLNPQKPVIGPKPVGDSDKVKEDPFLQFYQPPPPIIHLPDDQHIFYDVPIQIEGVSQQNKPPIVAIEAEFQRFNKSCRNLNNPSCWIPVVLGPQTQKLNTDFINIAVPYNKFEFKGHWRIRARSYPKTGRRSKWTGWRVFQVKE